MSDSLDTDLLNIFRDEVGEYLESMNTLLMQIETAASPDAESLRELNRVAHSMKGASRAVGLKVIETIAHYMEEVFAAAMQSHLSLSPDVCDLLYDGLDLIQTVVDGDENEDETLALVLSHLEQVVAGSAGDAGDVLVVPAVKHNNGAEPEPPPVEVNHKTHTAEIPRMPSEIPAAAAPSLMTDTGTVVMRPAEESIRVPVSKLDHLMAEVSELLVARLQSEERVRDVQHLRRLHSKWRREWQTIRAAYIRLARHMQDEQGHINDDIALIFKFLESNQRYLQNASQMLGQLAQVLGQDNLRMTTLADELQDDVSRMRMVAFETLVGGFQRIIRDLARDTGKQVYFDVAGMAVEVDKTVLDALKDPIMHLLRNAVDHGIELPEVREHRGKPGAGRLSLEIEQRGNEIVVRVRDDGRGIDTSALKQKALNTGVLTAQEADAMSEDDLRGLIFHPGLTTAAEITAISGRGIGMDIVRDRVESLRGRVSVTSVPGEGTTISLNVPVSLTRIRCVLLDTGEDTYAVPSAVIVRMTTLRRDDVFTAENRDMIVLDERPVPLVSMAEVLGIPGQPRTSDEITVLALRAADRTVAFEVDGLESERELVLKPLGPEIARAQFVSGAALLGTGAVLIVLDANDLVRSATGRSLPARRAVALKKQTTTIERRLSVLVADDSITTRTLEKNILETAGFIVTVAIDGDEAWQKISEQHFDVVISDVEMPKITGLELVRLIKGSERTKHIPVILLTSLGKPEHQEAGLKAGADAYLVKSQFDQGELLRMIRAVV
jgi:two-component system chemotaxis sensor kinase CheA